MDSKNNTAVAIITFIVSSAGCDGSGSSFICFLYVLVIFMFNLNALLYNVIFFIFLYIIKF